jgi:hypothetical protein
MSPGGFDRRNLIRLQFREVRELSDVGDERAGEKCGEVLDELGGRAWPANGAASLLFRAWPPSLGGEEPDAVKNVSLVALESIGSSKCRIGVIGPNDVR